VYDFLFHFDSILNSVQFFIWTLEMTTQGSGCQGGEDGTGRSSGQGEWEQCCNRAGGALHKHFFFNSPTSSSFFCIPKSPLFLLSPPTFPPMTSSGHLSFQQLNTAMQSTQPSHPMLHFSSPFQVFQNSLQQSSQWMSEQGQSGR
jgi:hypothetical protein